MPTSPRSHASATRSQSNRALGTLALGAFVIGTAELVVIGILNLIAKDEAVSVSTTGQLVTAYALGIAIGAPILTALTTRFGRRLVLITALGAFVVGNMLAALATRFGMLLIARVLTGSIHGLFIGVASVIAAGLVAPERRGRAISMVFGGIAVSTVLGVPAGTLIGQTLGWHAAFAIVALAAWGLAGFAVIPALQPRVITLAGAGGDLAATLGASAVNTGIAAGSLIGGAALAGHGASAAVLTAMILCALALRATWATRLLTPPAGNEPTDTAAAGLDRGRPAPRLVPQAG